MRTGFAVGSPDSGETITQRRREAMHCDSLSMSANRCQAAPEDVGDGEGNVVCIVELNPK
jgi:hypothetical protein